MIRRDSGVERRGSSNPEAMFIPTREVYHLGKWHGSSSIMRQLKVFYCTFMKQIVLPGRHV